MTLYTVYGPPGRSHSTTNYDDILRVKEKWEKKGFTTRVKEEPYTPIVQDYAYWIAIYPNGNFPEGI